MSSDINGITLLVVMPDGKTTTLRNIKPDCTVEELPVLEHGADGEGAKLLRYLLTHGSQPQFVYTHEWQRGDLIVYDNRCTWCRCLISALLFARALRESA